MSTKASSRIGLALYALTATQIGALFACGDGTGLDSSDQLSVRISGPDVVALSCELSGLASYSATIQGTAVNVGWSVNGDTTGLSNIHSTGLTYGFHRLGSHTIAVSIVSGDGHTASDEMVTVATPPEHASSCLAVSRIRGDFAHLIRPGQQDVTSTYSVNIPKVLDGSVDHLEWYIRRPGTSDMEIVQEGSDTTSVDVTFAEAGDHTLYLEVTVEGVKDTLRKWVGVKQGEPIAEGTLVFNGQNRADSSGIFLMDLPTGLVQPIVVAGRLGGGQMACEPDGDRIVFGRNRDLGGGESGAPDLWIMSSEGEQQKRITDEAGVEWFPSWSVNDVIAHLRDTRSNFERDELYTMNLDGGNVVPLGGPNVNPSIAGFGTSWSPDGSTIALGSARHQVTADSVERRIKLISSDGRNVRLLHERNLSEAYQPDSTGWPVHEGDGGVAFSPDGQWIANVTVVGPEDLRIYRVRTDGSGELEELSKGFGPLVYTGDGEHLIFAAGSPPPDPDGFYGFNMFMMPAAGGAAINLTAITASPPNEFVDSPGCWLPRRD
jgi:hypothetical protein